jgi:2,5-furandicarboxylate decarboxylase 1
MQEGLRDYIDERIRSRNKIDTLEYTDYGRLQDLQYEYRKKNHMLFIKNIKDYDFCLATNLFSSRHELARILGCDYAQLHMRYKYLTEHPIEPVTIEHGPCQENVSIDEEVDLNKIPVFQFNKGDAGKFITAGIVVAEDKTGGTRNLSIHRLQIKNKNTLCIKIGEASHLEILMKRSADSAGRFPIAICIGNHPAEILASITSLNYGKDEYGVAGAIRNESLELVQCVTSDIKVPANSEIILEGFIDGQKDIEGPFGDFMGFYEPEGMRNIVHLTAITCRGGSPIYQSIRCGSGEDSMLYGLAMEMKVFNLLLENGIQVIGVNFSPMVFSCIVQIKKQNDMEPSKIINLVFKNSGYVKYCFVVDDDVDCYDIEDVWWAVAARSTPGKSLFNGSLSGFTRDPDKIHFGKIGIDATVSCNLSGFYKRATPFS